MYVDHNGLIVQKDGDGGDTAQREGMWAVGMIMNAHFNNDQLPEWPAAGVAGMDKALSLLNSGFGEYVRNPDPTKWYSSPLTTSRDQLIGLIAGMSILKERKRLSALALRIISRFSFAQNSMNNDLTKKQIPDFIMPQNWGMIIRGLFPFTILLYPLLLICDLCQLCATLVGLLPYTLDDNNNIVKRTPDQVDDNSEILNHIIAYKFMSTPLSWLARKLYSKFRPINNGNLLKGETSRVMGALVWYHRAETGGNFELAELFRTTVENIFK